MASRQWQGSRASQREEEESETSETNSAGVASSSANTGHRKGSGGPPPSYNGSREAGVFEEYKLRARLWLVTTNLEGRARGPRLMQALTERAFESVKHLVDDAAWMSSPTNGDELLDLLAKPEYYGREEIEALYLAMGKLFYSDLRKPEDDLPAFRNRFDEAVRKIKKHNVQLPQEALGFLFLKQSKVSGESLERLITMTNGDLKLDSVVDGLRRLKMKLFEAPEDVNTKKKMVWAQETVPEEDDEYPPGDPLAEDEEVDLLEEALNELDGESLQDHEVTEDGAKEILMTLIKQKVSRPTNMSYKQVQQQKKEVRNGRGFRTFEAPQRGAPQGGHTMRRDLQQLKAVTKCKACGQVGHWHRECPSKARASNASNVSNASGASQSSSTQQGWWSMVHDEDPAPPRSSVSDIHGE